MHLRRRQSIKRGRNLLLPRQAILAVNLRPRLKIIDTLLQQSSPQDDFVGPHGILLVVDMRSAVLAVVLFYPRVSHVLVGCMLD